MKEVVIVDGLRSPIGRFGGGLAGVRPDDLLGEVYKGLMERTGVDPATVTEVYAGCGNQAGEDNSDVARMALLLAGFPKEVPGVTVNRNCASGLDAVNLAAKGILSGEGEIFIGSGVESMSRAPWTMPKPERLPALGHPKIYDTTVGWRYPNPRLDAVYPIVSLGEGADIMGEELAISRQDQDAFAVESHRRAVEAIHSGRFKDEIHPIAVPQRKGPAIIVDTDEHPRYRKEGGRFVLDTSLEDMARLRPAFRKGGTVTAGNSSGVNDGAAALLLMSAEKAAELGLQPMARWVACAAAGVAPKSFGYGPIPATRKLLERAGLTVGDLGLIELNEAFAAQALGCMGELGLDAAITNVNGGAIALGHPLGCSGARILITLLNEMKRRAPQQKKPYYGLATLCVGVGMGVSTLVQWIGD